jgi:hypothetical protein
MTSTIGSSTMTRLRDDDFVRPSCAAILRQQQADDARFLEPAHVGAAPSVGFDGSHAPGAENKRQEQCWVICDLEEPLRYI